MVHTRVFPRYNAPGVWHRQGGTAGVELVSVVVVAPLRNESKNGSGAFSSSSPSHRHNDSCNIRRTGMRKSQQHVRPTVVVSFSLLVRVVFVCACFLRTKIFSLQKTERSILSEMHSKRHHPLIHAHVYAHARTNSQILFMLTCRDHGRVPCLLDPTMCQSFSQPRPFWQQKPSQQCSRHSR